MKDVNGNELGKGIVKTKKGYHKCFEINQNQLILSGWAENIEEIREETFFCYLWRFDNDVEQIEYESLGVFDSKGREYKVGDAINVDGEEREIIGAVKSIAGDEKDYIQFEYNNKGGWNNGIAKDCTIHHSALEKPTDSTNKFKEKLEGFAEELGKIVKRMKEK